MSAQRTTEAAVRFWSESGSQESYEVFIKKAKLGGAFWLAADTL